VSLAPLYTKCRLIAMVAACFCFGQACAPDAGKGTFTATISGRSPATVAGSAESKYSTTEAPTYYIGLRFPKAINGLEQYANLFMLMSSPRRIAVGEYGAVPIDASSVPVNTLEVVLDSEANGGLWLLVDGVIQIRSGGTASTSAGSFRIRCVSYADRADTIVVAGQFDIR
jgi:hypothetical protein